MGTWDKKQNLNSIISGIPCDHVEFLFFSCRDLWKILKLIPDKQTSWWCNFWNWCEMGFFNDSYKLSLKFKTFPNYLYIGCSRRRKLFKVQVNKNILQLTMSKDRLANFDTNIQRSMMIMSRLENKNFKSIHYYDIVILMLLGGIHFLLFFNINVIFLLVLQYLFIFLFIFLAWFYIKCSVTENFTFCIYFPVSILIHFISWSWLKIILSYRKRSAKKWLTPWANTLGLLLPVKELKKAYVWFQSWKEVITDEISRQAVFCLNCMELDHIVLIFIYLFVLFRGDFKIRICM